MCSDKKEIVLGLFQQIEESISLLQQWNGERMRLKRPLGYCSCWPFLSSSVQIMAIGDMGSF